MTIERLFADTNLFLRYITNDVPAQADAIEKLLINAAAGQCLLVVNALVVAEIVWTLESYYRLSKSDICSKVLAILNTPGLEIAESDLLLQAMLWYAEKNVDFIDAYNAAWMVSHDISAVSTFDKKHYARFEGIKVSIPK